MNASAAAAPLASVEIVEISSPTQCGQLARVLADVWGFVEDSGVASQDNLRALAHSSSYVAGVLVGGTLVGGGFGWPTRVGNEWRLHSHVIGFLSGYRALGLGARIKHHQRDFARATGLDAIEWTYDPLVAANARFNLAKLGARVERFQPDFYGEMTDTFSAGLGSDRFVVRWGLDDEPPSLPGLADLEPLLAADADGAPISHAPARGLLRAQIHPDMVGQRAAHRENALRWRDAFAGTVGQAVLDGARVIGFANDTYVIER